MTRPCFAILLLCLLVTGCREARVPEAYQEVPDVCWIYPDYRDVTVPVNIAPLHFEWTDSADDVVSRLRCGDEELVLSGRKVCPSVDDWRRLTRQAVGQAILVDMFVKNQAGWSHYRPFSIMVSPDSIDAWLTYRLIAPSYVVYDELTLNQRCLESYEERLIYNNKLVGTSERGQCVNCHHSQRGNPRRTMFHARQYKGGTVFNLDGKLMKADLKTDSTGLSAAYPAWHPFMDLIAFSVNNTKQSFLTRSIDKIEVFDTMSDLILYDIEGRQITIIENDPLEFETFPCWSPDGRWLYYSSAHFERRDTTIDLEVECALRYKDLHYNIYRKPFNPNTKEFGKPEKVFSADSLGLSATLPRISPDGQWLAMTVAPYGSFHVWHHEADLWVMDLHTGQASPLDEANSSEAESYHTWSSNGRWMVFSSRRYDGNYTRPFFTHISADGKASKPFELPSADPDFHRQFMKSYNVPEFLSSPIEKSPREFVDILNSQQ